MKRRSFLRGLAGLAAAATGLSQSVDRAVEAAAKFSQTLKAKWTVESAADLRSYHGIDAELELIEAMSQKAAADLDEAIMADAIGWGAVKREEEIAHLRSLEGQIPKIDLEVTTFTLVSGPFISKAMAPTLLSLRTFLLRLFSTSSTLTGT